MGCGCKKRAKVTTPVVEESVNEELLAAAAAYLPDRQSDSYVMARCLNCVGLLRTYDGKYLPMHTGEYYSVLQSDTKRWISQGWVIEVKKG